MARKKTTTSRGKYGSKGLDLALRAGTGFPSYANWSIGILQLAISLEIAIWDPRLQFGNLSLSLFAHVAPIRYHHPLHYFEVLDEKFFLFPRHLCSKECVSLKLTPPYGQTPTDEVKISKSQIAISAKFESEIAISAKLQSLV